MIRWFRNLFASRDHAHTARAVLERARIAVAKRDAALKRGDTRDYGRALMELQQVQIERLELGI
jgi:hypothetical protein